MNQLLRGMRVVEASAFVAGPSCAMHLAQFGAEVIRLDQMGGGPDYRRWPLAPGSQSSLYWEGLNKSKKSVALDLTRAEGRELAIRIITAAGENSGLFVTNYPVAGYLAYENLKKRRNDLICVRIMGWNDGRSAVDYTVNAAVGVPAMTGPTDYPGPVNHVLPAWDLMAGAYAAFCVIAAERARANDGQGRELRVPLADLAIASLGHLGQIGEVTLSGQDRARMGNDLFGAFGRDFVTGDGKRLIIVAITASQWAALLKALDLKERVAELEAQLGVDFSRDEGLRFEHRSRLTPLVETAIRSRSFLELAKTFDSLGACWAPYQTLNQALHSDAYFSTANPLLAMIEHPSGHRYPAAGAAATVCSAPRIAPTAAPELGQHTDEVLEQVLHLSQAEIAALHDAGVVGSAR